MIIKIIPLFRNISISQKHFFIGAIVLIAKIDIIFLFKILLLLLFLFFLNLLRLRSFLGFPFFDWFFFGNNLFDFLFSVFFILSLHH